MIDEPQQRIGHLGLGLESLADASLQKLRQPEALGDGKDDS